MGHLISERPNPALYFKVIRKQLDQSLFIQIEEIEAPYKIVNNLTGIDLKCCQAQLFKDKKEEWIHEETLNVKSGGKRNFAWTNLMEDTKRLEVSFVKEGKEDAEIFYPLEYNKSKHGSKNKTLPKITKSTPQTKQFSLDGLNHTENFTLALKGPNT